MYLTRYATASVELDVEIEQDTIQRDRQPAVVS